MTTSIRVFDTTLQKSNEWLNDVSAELHTDDRQFAYRVLREVLHALRDRITSDEASHLGAQLPMLLRGMYYEGWTPSSAPTRDNREAFLERIAEAMADQPGPPDPERWARAVFAVVARRVDAGEVQDVVGILPEALGNLWPESVRR
jgi:uncharacterized protein (DUF2267 family)